LKEFYGRSLSESSRAAVFERPFNQERLLMKRLISLSLAVVITICMIVASERRARGYVDPGSGLIALQGIASVLAAYAYYVRRRIRAFFTRKKAPIAVLPVANKTGESQEVA
jgi:hypothetical protein